MASTLKVLVSANPEASTERILKDIDNIQKQITASNKEIFVDARIKKIHIDKSAANYVKNELKKMFNTITVDIDGNVLGFGAGAATAVRKQTDEIRKAISAAQKKLGNIQIDYGANFTAADGTKFEQFRQELERMAKDLGSVIPSDVAIISDQMDVFAHAMLEAKKATAENAKELEKFAAACQRADKMAMDIEQNYLGKANAEQKEKYDGLSSKLSSWRANPNTTTQDIDGIANELEVLRTGIKATAAESDKAAKAANAHAAAMTKSLNSARLALDQIKAKNWDIMDDSQKQEYQDLSREIITLRNSGNLTDEVMDKLVARIKLLGTETDKTASSVKVAAAASEKEAKALQSALTAFDKAWASVERMDLSGLTDEQKKAYREIKEIVDLVNADRGGASSGVIKQFTAEILRNKGDLQAMLANLKKVQSEAKRTDTALKSMGDKLGGFEQKYLLDLDTVDLNKLEDFKKKIAELQAEGMPAAKTVQELGDEIQEFMLRIQTGGNRSNFLSSQFGELMKQFERIQNIGGDTQGLDLRGIKSVENALAELMIFSKSYSGTIPEEIEAMILEIQVQFNKLGTIDISKLRRVQELLTSVPAFQTDDYYVDVAHDLMRLVDAAGKAADAVDDLHHEMSDDSRSQGFQNRVNDDIRKLDEFYEKHTKLRNNKAFSDEYQTIRAGFDVKASEEAIKKNEDAMKDYIHRAKEAGLTTDTFGEKIQKAYQKFGGWAIVSGTFMRITQAIRDMINNVVRLDSCLTELRKVTDETSDSYDAFMQRTKNTAKEIGSTVTDLVSATADWGRLGYSLSDAEELAKISTIYANVGDDIEGIDDATANLISTIQGFKELDASDALNVVDVLNRVSNEFPASAGGLGESLRRSSAALSAAGNTLQESVALITAADAVLQDPSSTGTMMKTISMYLRAAKTDLEAAGESTDGMASSVSKLRSEIMALTGNRVDIMLNED